MPRSPPFFIDRADAGRKLASRLKALDLPDPVVYALPRGGVPLAVEIAKALKAPVELVLVRKIGAPDQPEFALAAVVDGEQAQTVVNEEVGVMTSGDRAYIEKVCRREFAEIERRRALYLGGRRRISSADRTAIVVDDGIATGATAKAALRALRRQGAAKVVLAVAVAQAEKLEEMRVEADEVVCLEAPRSFSSVGAFYEDFHQLTDDDTLDLLRQVWDGEARAIERREV